MGDKPIPPFLKKDYNLAITEPNLEGTVMRCLTHRDGSTSFFLEGNSDALFFTERVTLPIVNGNYVRGIATDPREWDTRTISDLEIYDVKGGKLLHQYSSESSPRK